MAVQQRKVTRSRKAIRGSHHGLEEKHLVSCKKCGYKLMPHRVCKICGEYKGRKVIETENV